MYGHTNPTIRSTEDNEQVGPKMHSAMVTVNTYGSLPSKKQLAEKVGANGSLDYGYRVVNRCINKDLIAVHPDHENANPHGKGAVVLTDKGARYLNSETDADLDTDNYAPAGARYRERSGVWKRYDHDSDEWIKFDDEWSDL